MEVIAKCAFGITISHLGEENDPFIKKAKMVFSPRVNKSPLIMLPSKFFNNSSVSYINLQLALDGFSNFPETCFTCGRKNVCL